MLPTATTAAPAATTTSSSSTPARTRTLPKIDWASLPTDKDTKRRVLNNALSTLPPISDRFNKDPAAIRVLQEGLQTRLDAMNIKFTVPQNGAWDAATKEAVGLLQDAAGIKKDLKVGQKTWSVILGAPKDIQPDPGFHLLDISELGDVSEADFADLLGFEGAQYNLDAHSAFDGVKADYALLGQQPDAHQVRMALRQLAHRLGLTVTSEGGGQHTATSYHYKEDEHGTSMGLDVAGSPAAMAQYAVMAKALIERAGFTVKELFYDPLGGIKNGQRVGSIGGHGDHVHVAV